MAENDGQEKTEQPTSKRLQESREKGQIARSRELNTVMILLVGAVGLIVMGDEIVAGLAEIMSSSLQIERTKIFDTKVITSSFFQYMMQALLLLAPFLVLMMIIALTAPMLLSGWSFSVQSMGVKLEKLNPIKGLGRIFSWRGILELIKALAKFSLVGTIVILWMWNYSGTLMQLGREPLEVGLVHMTDHLGWAFLMFSLTLLIVVAVDVPFQLWDHNRQLRMSLQEIKDEHKQTEGSPEIKGRVRSMQREIAKRRMMEEVPKADVIVTNPDHFSVALRYDQEAMKAPKVVAKGVDFVALQIRNIGMAHDVPIVVVPSLARSLYYSTELDKEVPDGLYLAIAQLLAYVYQLRHHDYTRYQQPEMPEFPIPDDLRRDR